MGLGASGGDILPPTPNRRHEMQFLGNLIQRGVFGEPLERVHYRLLVGHGENLHLLPQRARSALHGILAVVIHC